MRSVFLLCGVLAAGCSDGSETTIPDGALNRDLAVAGSDLAGADLAGVDLASSTDLAMPPVSGEPSELSGITAKHNSIRANVMPAPSTPLPPLTWSNTLAQDAQTWANGCKFMHSGNGHGENIYASYGSTVSGPAVVQYWADEVADYNYAANTCSGTCGHYTQVVWRDTTQLGCAIKTCNQNSPFGNNQPWSFVVCDYDPPGNYNGTRPY